MKFYNSNKVFLIFFFLNILKKKILESNDNYKILSNKKIDQDSFVKITKKDTINY